jgi:WD40 repeat protein
VESSISNELPLDLDFDDAAAAADASELPDFLSDATSPALSAPTASIQLPADDDEGYAIVEEDFGKPAEAPAWLNPTTEVSADDLDEILIADDSAKQAKPDETPELALDSSEPSLSSLAASAPVVHDPLDDLLDDEIRIAPEEKPVVHETPPECPECKAALKPGSMLCIACGYNLKTGQKMQAAPEAKGKGGKAKPKKEKSAGGDAPAWKAKFNDPRVKIAVGGGGVVLLLAISGWLLLGGEAPKPVASPVSVAPGPETPASPAISATVAPDGVATVAPASVDPSRATLASIPSGVNGKAASFDFSVDGKLLAIGDENGSATIWDADKGESRPPLATGVSGPVRVAFDADAKQLLTGFSGGAKLWDIEAGSVREFKSPVDGLFAARFAPDGKSFFTSGPTSIFSTVDLAAGGRVNAAKVPLPPGFVPVVDITPDGKFGILGADEGLLMVWDLAAGRPVAQLEGHTARVAAVAISPDGKRAMSAAGGPEYRTIGKERFLMSSRPTDVNVRVWDATTGKELWRLHTPPEKPVTCLAFSPDGKHAAIVAGEVQVIDLDTKQQLTQITPVKPGAASEPGALIPPTEPFRLAAFFPNGKRLVTTCQNSGIHVWSLPENPESKPLPDVSIPVDLASFKLASWDPIAPLLIPATAASDDKQAAERLAIASKAADRTAERLPLVGKLRGALASKPRTPESLVKFAKSCQGKEFYLEAEECLRAALMADPSNHEARQEYEDLKLLGPKGTGPVSLTRAWAKEVSDLEDAGLRPEAPRKSYVVSIPIEVAVVDKVTKLDGNTLVGMAGEEKAVFLGIHHRATGAVTGARKTPGGGSPAAGQLQVWEAMAVGKDRKSGKTIVQFANRKMPVQEQQRSGASAAGAPKVKMVSDTSKVKEDYKGPYEALFAVPEGETLSEIRWEETQPVRVLGDEPKSLDELALDENADLAQRLAAIEALGVSPTEHAAETLLKLLADGDDKLFDATRAAMRGVRRRANLISPEYLPTPEAAEARLMSIAFGKIDGSGIAQLQQPSYAQPAAPEQQLPIISNYSFCKTLWNLDKPGKYLARVAVFGEPPTFQKQLTQEFEFTAAEPNLYVVQTKVDRDMTGEVQLIELWRDNKLVERRILSASSWAASSLAARLPLEPPVKSEGDDGAPAQPAFSGANPSADGAPAMITNLFPGTLTSAFAAPLLGSQPKGLPPVERATLEALLTSLPVEAQPKIRAAMVELARLDMGNGPLTSTAIDWLKQLPGDASTGLFIRLAEVASPPAALAAIDALHSVGEKSAAACRTLIDLQQGPADVRKAAVDAVNDLMTQGVIAHEGDNWRYHGESHYPEEPKAEAKPADNETAG